MNLRHLLFALILIVSTLVTSTVSASDDTIHAWADAVRETTDRGASILIIPMAGQTATDIRTDIYEGFEEDIKQLNPDLIVIEINCSESIDEFYGAMSWIDFDERGLMMGIAENLPSIAEMFRTRLKNIKQVAYVKDSEGIATLLTLSWDRIYMEPTAQLTGTYLLARQWGHYEDEDVRNKMRGAWTINGKILAQKGLRSPALLLSLVDPQNLLSGRWDGKRVEWFDHKNGDFVLDRSVETVPRFTATQAEELCISEATVNSLDDVLLLNDIREYHIVGKEITNELNKYVKDWRKGLTRAQELWGDFQQQAGWATGDQRKRWLVKNKNTIMSLKGICRKYPAVTYRMYMKHRAPFDPDNKLYGLDKIVEEIERELRKPDGPARRGGGPSLGGGGGGMGR
jgi:hypothetical protein